MKAKYHIFITTLLPLLVSCSWISEYMTGDTVTVKHNLSGFVDRIDVKGSFHIIMIQDTVSYALVTCPNKIQEDVEVNLSNFRLYIHEHVGIRWMKNYPIIEVEIHMAYLPMIEAHQPCKLSIPSIFKSHAFYLVDWGNYVDCNINVDVVHLVLSVSGESFGTYRVAGKAEYAHLHARGVSVFDLSEVKIKYCKAYQNSVSDMHIWVEESLNLSILESGNVLLKGNPHIELAQMGTGKLISDE